MLGVAHTHKNTQKHTQNNIPKHFSQRGGGKHMCDMRAKQKKRIFIHLFFPTVFYTYTLVIHTHTHCQTKTETIHCKGIFASVGISSA